MTTTDLRPPTTEDVDVLVVGAGPVGLATAVTLALSGVDVAVVDRDSGPTTQSRAVWIHPRTTELLDGLGVADAARAEGVLLDRIDLHRGASDNGSIHYDGQGRTPFPEGLLLEQSRTQYLLLDRAATLGVHVRWATSAVELQQDEESVVVRLAPDDGSAAATSVRARWVVGADGATSTVRARVGLELVGDTYPTSFFTGDLVVRVGLHRQRAHLSLTPSRTFALLPLPGQDRWRVVATVPPDVERTLGRDAGPTGGPALDRGQVESLLEGLRVPHALQGVEWATLYRSHHRVVDTYRVGRVLLAGDAAHIHSPAGGLGMNTGIGDGVGLAWRLALAVRGRVDDAAPLLDDYAAERRGVAQDVLRTSDRAFALQASSGRLTGLLRAAVMPAVPRLVNLTDRGRRLAFDLLSGLGTTYRTGGRRSSPGRRALAVGDRIPWTVASDGSTSHDDVALDRFLLLGVGTPCAALEAGRNLLRGVGLDVSTQRLPAEHGVLRGVRVAAGTVVLVRPDGHVAWLGPEQQVDHVAEVVARWGLRGEVPAPA